MDKPVLLVVAAGPGVSGSVARRFAREGYDAALVGKLHLAGTQGRVEPRGDDGYRGLVLGEVVDHHLVAGQADAFVGAVHSSR